MADALAPATLALLRRAADSDRAAALLDGPLEPLYTALLDAADHADWVALSEPARWNLLWLWAELSTEVDAFAGRALWSALGRLFARQLHQCAESGAVQMAFDFYFRRPTHPLVPLSLPAVLELLTGLLAQGGALERTALHGLGHLVALLSSSGDNVEAVAAVQAAIDAHLASTPGRPPAGDGSYAQEARAGRVD